MVILILIIWMLLGLIPTLIMMKVEYGEMTFEEFDMFANSEDIKLVFMSLLLGPIMIFIVLYLYIQEIFEETEFKRFIYNIISKKSNKGDDKK